MSSDIACRWMRKSVNDLEVAELILENGYPGESTFHSQQAAEKALKALLVALGVQPPRSHNIRYLLRILEENGVDTTLPGRAGAERLTAYAVEARYPDFGEEPTPEEALEALETARKVVEWAKERLREIGVTCTGIGP